MAATVCSSTLPSTCIARQPYGVGLLFSLTLFLISWVGFYFSGVVFVFGPSSNYSPNFEVFVAKLLVNFVGDLKVSDFETLTSIGTGYLE